MSTVISESHRAVLDAVRAEVSSHREGRRGPGRLPDQLRRDILALIDAGVDPASIATETGLSLAALERWQRTGAVAGPSDAPPSPPPRVFAVEPPSASTPRASMKSGSMRVQFGAFIVTIELAESA